MGYGVNRFVSHIDPNLVCGICAGVLEKAVITPCGHSFCEKCLQTWLDRPEHDTCPSCRSIISMFEIIPVLALRGLVDGLVVYCDNIKHGCSLVVKLENLESHLKNCGYALVECAGCKSQIKRCELAEHHSVCEAISSLAIKKAKTEADEITIDLLTRQIATLELDLKHTKDALKNSQDEVQKVEKELRDMRYQIELRSVDEDEFDRDWDPDYNYGYSPHSIAQLSSLLSRLLLNKPYYVDRTRIFNAIKRCYEYYHSYAGYSQDVNMLLATAYASNWFTENQRWNFDCWLETMARERYLRPVSMRN